MAWICLNNAFFSIVEVPDDKIRLLVRARRQGDIEAIFPGAMVKQTIGRDYLWRAIIPRQEVAQTIAEKLIDIDYGNFKNSVQDSKLHSAYGKVWHIMSDLQAIPPYSK